MKRVRLYTKLNSFSNSNRELAHTYCIPFNPNTNRVKIISQDVKIYIKEINNKNKFDLIFLDPPYRDVAFLNIITLIKEKKMFNKNHKIIIHRERGCEEVLSDYLKIVLEKNYGRSKIIFGSF